MPAHLTARERARAELTAAIKDEARRQLGLRGADGLSLRAVARELGMVSSALYRYFPSRDDLLTALIIDAYNAVGAAVETAAERGSTPGERWRIACAALRTWAREHPHEYALIYGSPVPGYRAPQDTVTPASRVPTAFLGIVHDAWQAGTIEQAGPAPELTPRLREQLDTIANHLAPGVPQEVLARGVIAWTQVYGMLSFELTGQFVGTFEPADDFFANAVEQLASFVGLS
ncbi:TetR/AcrR family transcriptional regulator [Saccharomonospora sp. NPDC046836]|uniref:TetR/AcrR family transcriptional regulator n=1 Tax=Saccharomonospora sp. NPDC046836 TaxID=3156921 RepID=UPI0034103C84